MLHVKVRPFSNCPLLLATRPRCRVRTKAEEIPGLGQVHQDFSLHPDTNHRNWTTGE